MKKGKWLVLGILGLVLLVGLTGCKIISASPDPGKIIDMKPGDKQLFNVNIPVNTATTRCVWTINRIHFLGSEYREVVSEGKNEFELEFNPDSKLSNKKNIVTCEYQSYQLVSSCGYTSCLWYWEWVTTDSRKWEVRTNPNSATVITGDYIIENDSDLQLLKGYNTVTGSIIVGWEIENLEGLESLTTIGDGLGISGNNYINNLNTLGNLTSIGGLYISSNDALTSLDGLENLTSFRGDLEIEDNAALTSLSGLENLTSIGGSLIIGGQYNGNNALINLTGLENIRSVGGDLSIRRNNVLNSLSNLENLTSVGGYLLIGENPALANLSGLDNTASIRGNLYVYQNTALTSLSALENMTSVGGDFHISSNPVLTSLSGLDNFTSIGGDLVIEWNRALTSLSGLENLTSVGGDLIINDNAVLTILGMTGLQRVGGDFWIIDNTLLCKSLAIELRNQVLAGEGIGGDRNIFGNKDCTTP